MNKIRQILLSALISAGVPAFPANAAADGGGGTAKYCRGLVGFANYSDMGLQGTTGGMGGTIVHVTTREDFARYAGAKEPYIIIIDADLKGHYDYSANPKQKHDVISVASNKTIIGGGKGARLDSLGLDIKDRQNIIIRNLRISKADPDAIAFRNTHHVWVDHCDLSSQKEENDANDGLLDFTYGSSYLTVSWCKFHDHDKTSICSSGTRNISDYGRQRVTYHHNAFMNCTQRNPRIGYGLGHIFNDYNEGNTLYAIGMFARAVVNVENCHFKNVREAFCQMYSADSGKDDAYWGFLKSEGNIFESTSKSTEGNSGGFDACRYYDYDFAMNPASDVSGLTGMMGCMEGIEGDIIPFPGDGATGIVRGTVIRCGDIEGATGYRYSVGTSPDALQECSPEAMNLEPLMTYYWQVTVTGGKYDGTESAIFRFTTAPGKACFPTPDNGEQEARLREIEGETLPCAPLTLRWRDGFAAERYNILFADNENLDDAVTATVTAPAYRPEGLRHGRQYFWRVDAVNSDGSVTTGDLWQFRSPVSHAREGRNEVEHAVRGGLCFPERDVMQGWIVASNDSCNVGDQGPGYMSFVWAGKQGVYDFSTAYFDESSGQGSFSLYINESRKDNWTASKNKNTMEVRRTAGVVLEKGDEIRLEFHTQKNMRCRTDYIDITPAATAIVNVSGSAGDSADTDAPAYSMSGQRVSSSARGVVVVRGKKKMR
ncbi:MAG: hypothetical protein NC344_01800 [Bacteroidales bacterium]|nr:hypothetical protein [Bacteroidales bacterium]MCM1146567.1 hypothetical protein [Bacteroidales bacterium]MCM1205959.1 hypothetical protein [Bacillota bacterium]MCM1510161.1 hypothetical protein [Clostridium sp.]